MNRLRADVATALARHLGLEPERIERLLVPPKRPELGDLAFPCFAVAKELGCAPPELAARIARGLELPVGVASAEPAGAFVNFRFDRAVLAAEVIERVLSMGDAYGRSREGEGRTIVMDYSSPNIAKPFHVGHLRSALIGSSLRRLYSSLGYRVVGINHLGDWGTQFGLVWVGCRRWRGAGERLPRTVSDFVEVYQRAARAAESDPSVEDEARAWFRLLEEGDEEATRFWKHAREVSLHEFEKIYARLGVEFDAYVGESFYNDKMEPLLRELRERSLAQVSAGSLGIDLGGELGFAMLQKADGATLYLTRDLAAVEYRWREYRFDSALYVVGAPQTLHFEQLKAVLRRLGRPFAERVVHVPFGHVEGMSTRSGGAILLAEFLDEGHRRALQAFREEVQKRPEGLDEEEVAERVSLSAIVFSDLARGRIKDVRFDWDTALSFRGDTGPYLQYAHARINGIEAKARVALPERVDGSWLPEEEAHRLVTELERYPSVVQRAAAEYEPSVVAQYLLDLGHAFSRANDLLRVKDEPLEVAAPRMALFAATRRVLANGLRLLGIEPVERM
ncbi:MAG: arginine--tRNA ligase [Planctomycetota bacterium]